MLDSMRGVCVCARTVLGTMHAALD